jgi:hypothetical protein
MTLEEKTIVSVWVMVACAFILILQHYEKVYLARLKHAKHFVGKSLYDYPITNREYYLISTETSYSHHWKDDDGVPRLSIPHTTTATSFSHSIVSINEDFQKQVFEVDKEVCFEKVYFDVKWSRQKTLYENNFKIIEKLIYRNNNLTLVYDDKYDHFNVFHISSTPFPEIIQSYESWNTIYNKMNTCCLVFLFLIYGFF